jgi:hypothetical protein
MPNTDKLVHDRASQSVTFSQVLWAYTQLGPGSCTPSTNKAMRNKDRTSRPGSFALGVVSIKEWWAHGAHGHASRPWRGPICMAAGSCIDVSFCFSARIRSGRDKTSRHCPRTDGINRESVTVRHKNHILLTRPIREHHGTGGSTRLLACVCIMARMSTRSCKQAGPSVAYLQLRRAIKITTSGTTPLDLKLEGWLESRRLHESFHARSDG